MNCCAAQVSGSWEKPDESLRTARVLIREAKEAGAALIAFPEQYPTGWNPLSRTNIEDSGGFVVSRFRELARENSIALLGSFRELYSPRPRNTAVAMGKNGSILTTYAKMHLFTPGNEDRAFTAGDSIATFSLDGVRFGIAICYDIRFPDLFCIYRSAGVHAVIVPAAWPQNRIKYWELFIRSRAAENQMYIIGVNTTGTNPVDSYSGQSMVADPYGNIIARAGTGEELLYAEIDPDLVERTRKDFPVAEDRRDALYSALRNCSRA
ncbi:MAG: nitrilase-related carbon-nitrogen hydrolase [Methanoregula sp.]|jgi:predicted amidohydrolase